MNLRLSVVLSATMGLIGCTDDDTSDTGASTSNGATTDGATTDGATTDAATTDGATTSDDRGECDCFAVRDSPGELSPEGKTLDKFCSFEFSCRAFTIDAPFERPRELAAGAEPDLQCAVDALANGTVGTVSWEERVLYNIAHTRFITQHDDGRVFAWTESVEDLNRRTHAVREIELPSVEDLEACAASPDIAAQIECLYRAFEQPAVRECTEEFSYTDLW